LTLQGIPLRMGPKKSLP